MTGREWNDYFQDKLSPGERAELLQALETLDSYSKFQQVYGTQFRELAALIRYPLKAQTH